MLTLKNVRSGYDKIEVIAGISLDIEKMQIISIVGANGVGKSTLLKTICGMIKPQSGEIYFNDQRIDGLSPHEIVKLGISMVPEGRQLFNHLTVLENLEVGSSIQRAKAVRKESMEKMFELFPRLKERISQYAGTLSGGEQQMLAMARALMALPTLLIMDEPSWGLAPILVNEMFEQIHKIREQGTSILIVEQNVCKTLQMSDYGYVIERGSIVLQGSGNELLENKELKQAYLGI
ncbi:MAG: ABC transporter ATP-binding protein [Negativicutes bacterium]|nr:ABC transporter ATP-binding protein [Negativicutes bacterium]